MAVLRIRCPGDVGNPEFIRRLPNGKLLGNGVAVVGRVRLLFLAR